MCCAHQADASPWILPKDHFALSATYDYAYADQEFLATTGELTDFSLNGRYQAHAYTLGVRLSITDFLELETTLPFKSVNYQADPVVLLPSGPDVQRAFDYYQDNIINLNQSIMGLGDMSLAARFKLTTYPIASSFEVGLSAPTGYDAPSGTFGDNPTSVEDFVENAAIYASPDNIKDDITLGDSAFAMTSILHVGYGHAKGFFIRGSAGFRMRNQGAGDLLLYEVKLGQLITPWLLIYGGVYQEKTVISGRVIGVSVAAEDPNLPARDYEGLKNLKPILISLDRDLLSTPIGLLIKPIPNVNFTLTYTPIISGRNVAQSHIVSVGVNLIRRY
jgi:hypothetical protein